MSPKMKEPKEKKWDLIKYKIFCIAKETINKKERQPMEWDKTFANSMSNKESMSKIYKQLTQLNIKKTTPLKKIKQKT